MLPHTQLLNVSKSPPYALSLRCTRAVLSPPKSLHLHKSQCYPQLNISNHIIHYTYIVLLVGTSSIHYQIVVLHHYTSNIQLTTSHLSQLHILYYLLSFLLKFNHHLVYYQLILISNQHLLTQYAKSSLNKLQL